VLHLINRVPLSPQPKRIMRVIVIVIGVLYLLRYIGYFPM